MDRCQYGGFECFGILDQDDFIGGRALLVAGCVQVIDRFFRQVIRRSARVLALVRRRRQVGSRFAGAFLEIAQGIKGKIASAAAHLSSRLLQVFGADFENGFAVWTAGKQENSPSVIPCRG